MPIKEASTKPVVLRSFVRRMVQQAHELRQQLSDSWPSNELEPLVQAAACAAPILAFAPQSVSTALSWLSPQLLPWERSALSHARTLSLSRVDATHLYDQFLHHHSNSTRNRHGVFFTPQPIANYIVTQIDQLLRKDFKLADGLATQSKIQNPKSKIAFLDPACGTGLFLLTLIDHLHRRFTPRRWNAFVPDLLSRLIGIEILPAAALLAKLNLTLKLAETGYDFKQSTHINIITGDALSPAIQSKIQNLNSKILPVILGNPPFSSLTTNTNDWIATLVRGDDEIRGYIRANGQQLNERKTWLHDDYVKFIRLAQWHVEQAGAGIVGFVTNHGYLDNATFRLMRHELLRVFPHIQIVDLHGNRKKHEIAPDGARDENVFHLDQGIAIGLFCRPATLARSASEDKVRSTRNHLDLWGPRDAKLASLASASLTRHGRSLSPIAPNYRFIPTPAASNHPEYSSAWSLSEAMPVSTTAPVTARDHFVVAFTIDELKQRIEQFRDLSIPDDEIRQRYFTRTRSARYQTGDTRSWQLSTARRTIAADHNWQRHIIRCLYRPFDWRYVFWHPAMIDWPRTEVTRHLIKGSGFGVQGSGENAKAFAEPRTLNPEPSLCLIARRQQLPTQPCTFFWIADGLALDGVIRSDNRGSESLFPLLLKSSDEGQTAHTANFASAFIAQFAEATELAWRPLGRGDLARSFGPEDLLAYIYALFHSPTYRDRYADSLRNDFPRIVPTKGRDQFAAMSCLGHELIELHSMRNAFPLSPPLPVSPSVSDFRAGGYPALKKWLQPKHRSPTDPEYTQIAAAIARTLEITQAIDVTTDD